VPAQCPMNTAQNPRKLKVRRAAPTDAAVLAEATGERPDVICPTWRSYPLAMAPPMAAEALGRDSFTIADLRLELVASWPAGKPVDVAFVEGAGGVASPQAADGDMATLIDAIGADLVVLVADATLGTTNLIRLCTRFLGERRPLVVHLNRFDPGSDLHRRNHLWLTRHEGLTITTDIPTLVAAAKI
jgi:dethiobiotin synthetase